MSAPMKYDGSRAPPASESPPASAPPPPSTDGTIVPSRSPRCPQPPRPRDMAPISRAKQHAWRLSRKARGDGRRGMAYPSTVSRALSDQSRNPCSALVASGMAAKTDAGDSQQDGESATLSLADALALAVKSQREDRVADAANIYQQI